MKTQHESMQKYEYYVYYLRDRDDWSKHWLYAHDLESAIEEAQHEWAMTNYTVWKKTFKLMES